MKNRVMLAVLVLFLIISGCKQSDKSIELKLNAISFTADITYYNENYIADCVINDEGDFSAQLTSPENLTGLKFSYNGTECIIEYNGIKIDKAENILPQSSAVGVINEIMKTVDGASITNGKGNYELKGSANGSDYTLTFAPSGLPISLQVSDLGMKVLFKNVKIVR